MFFTLLIHILNFVSIGYYLLYDLYIYILCIILNYKNSQFEQFIDNVIFCLQFSRNFVSMKDIKRKCILIVDLSKSISNKNILNKVVA